MELTQEYFDNALKGLATKKDLEKSVTKDDLQKSLEQTTLALMAYTDGQVERLAVMVAEGFSRQEERFDALATKLDTAFRRMDKLETKVQRIEDALHITL